jgi:RHS repeat-associated protein
MSFIVRGLVLLVILLSAERAYACTPGSRRSCSTEEGCVGSQYCYGDPERPAVGEWGDCAPSYARQACSACGTGGYSVCSRTTGMLGPCRPATPLGGDICGNACDDDANGAADESCAGTSTFDYCEEKPGGGYTRWTCGCGDGLNVGYCLGSSDPQDSCNLPGGCLKAPAFGTSGAAQAGGNYRCCVSNLPCGGPGYVAGEFQCGYGSPVGTPYECAPGTSCQDANQCGDTCVGVPATINHSTGDVTGQGASCRPADYRNSCTAAQGGLGSGTVSSGGVRSMMDDEECVRMTGPDGVLLDTGGCGGGTPSSTPVPGYTLHTGPRGGGDGPSEGGGGGGGGRGRGGGSRPAPSPGTNQCVASGGGVASSGLGAMSMPGISLTDLATRHSEVDLNLQGTVGNLSFTRRYVSSDETWKYLSMLSNADAPFLPSPFGASTTNRNSLRWWHGLYSFVRPRGMVPGVSTWAVRDTAGAILEYTACNPGTAGCFATPRTSTRWSTSQLFYTGGSSGHFILIQPGVGRFIYASAWQPPQFTTPGRYFLTRVEDEVLSGSGAPRVRLWLQYAAPALPDCPGASTLGNGVPYLSAVTTADGAQLRLYYKSVASYHHTAKLPQGRECVLDRIALRNDPNTGSTAETNVAWYQYSQVSGLEMAGALKSVIYPESGDAVTYSANGGTTWSVLANDEQVGSHSYTDGKVSSVTTSSGGAMSMGGSTGTCPLAQSTGSTNCTPAATQSAPSGDSMGTVTTFRRTYHTSIGRYLPHLDVYGFTDSCVTGKCTSYASGGVIHSRQELAESFLHLWYIQNKSNYSKVFKPTVATGATASAVIPQPLAVETRGIGATSALDPQTGVYTERTEFGYGNFTPGAPPEPFKPLVTERDVRASVLVPGQEAVTTTTYDSLTHRVKSVIQEGYTEKFNTVTGTWSGPVKTYVATFFFNHHKCSGMAPEGDARVLEVHGPCTVSGPGATDCSGTDFPITQYHYYANASFEPSNRANRLARVRQFPTHGGPNSCPSALALETVINSYDARGNITQLTDPAGVVTSFTYAGSKLTSTSVTGLSTLTTAYHYDGAHLTSVQSPTGIHAVRCYRKNTAPGGSGCVGGVKTSQVQWEAVAADRHGVDWSEAVVYTRWETTATPVRKAEYRSRRADGTVETRRVMQYHPDPHGRPVYTRVGGQAWGEYAATAAFDRNNNLTAKGLPFNAPPEFCKDTNTQGVSQLCARLGYDRGDRLTDVTESSADGVNQASTFSYDAHSQVSTVRTGCADAANCQAPEATYQHDDFGNLVRMQLPNSQGPTRLEYNALGKATVKQTETMRLANEWQVSTYDMLSRLKSVSRQSPSAVPASETLFQFFYDEDGVALPTTTCNRSDGEVVNLNSKGRLRYREDSFGRTWYRYNSLGRLVGEMRQRQGEASCNRKLETKYSYDGVGRPALVSYPYGRIVTYQYGQGARAHRVSGITASIFMDGGSSQTRQVVSNVLWEPFGGLRGYQNNYGQGGSSGVEYALGGNGTVHPWGCDEAFPSVEYSDLTGRLRSLRVTSGAFTPGAGAGDIYERNYTWKANQVVRTDTCLLGATTPRTEEYTFDRMLRLTGATRPSGNEAATGGAFLSQGFGYDRRGNRITFSDGNMGMVATGFGTTGPTVDRLLSLTPQSRPAQAVTFGYDADGRTTRKESGRYTSNAVANVLDLSYGPAGASGRGSARESVFRTATVNGLTYQYFYDAFGRRRAKQHPFNGVKDEFFHDANNTLLVDQGWNDVLQPGYRVTDEYVWLGGRPVMMIRGRLDTATDTHLSDATAECGRNGEQVACGERFMVTDHIGKPVVMLDRAGRVAGAADHQPFGHVNRRSSHEATVHPYPDDDGDTVDSFTQPPDSSLVRVRMRARYQFVDTQNDANGTDAVRLVDSNTGAVLASNAGPAQGQVVTSWVQPSNGSVYVNFLSNPAGTQPNAYSGVAVDSYEYQRYQVGAEPFWTPLGFPGQYHDAETDLFENWNRYYDASTGRYLQPEPLLQNPMYLRDMAAMGFQVPTYAYALNNPYLYADPNGLWVVGVGISGAGHAMFLGAEVNFHVTLDGTGKMAVMITPAARVGPNISLGVSLNLIASKAPTVNDLGGWGVGAQADCGPFSVGAQGAMTANDSLHPGVSVSPVGFGGGLGAAFEGGYSFLPWSGQVFNW